MVWLVSGSKTEISPDEKRKKRKKMVRGGEVDLNFGGVEKKAVCICGQCERSRRREERGLGA